jgi:LDH2 family malate/lactate/ureidoglycolate dehydrogenase
MVQRLANSPITRSTNGADFPRVTEASLRALTQGILEKQGMTPDDAATCAEILVTADLMGVDSHGVAHLDTHAGYIPGFRRGVIAAAPDVRIVHETPSTARLDGDGGFGPLIARRAMSLAIDKARGVGVGMVAVDNGRHFGAAGYYALMAAREDMIGIAFCNAKPQVFPANGSRRMLGTNAFAVAAPANSEDPFLLDMATSAVAMGKLEIAEREARAIPSGWGADEAGQQSVDVGAIRAGRGGLLPLGSSVETSSYKGQGLGMVVDILSGVLSGTGFSLVLDRNLPIAGFFFGAIRIDAFRPAEDFKQMMDAMLREFRACPPVAGADRVMVPGQREFEELRRRREGGIPLYKSVYEMLLRLKDEFGVETDLVLA